MTFENDVKLLSKLLLDIDKQLLEFNEIVPYEYNRDAYSPRLINLLLSTSSQIEAYCNLFIVECNLHPSTSANDGIKGVLREMNQNGVLSNMDWTTIFTEKFQPFDGVYEWWTKNNKIKHSLATYILSVKYHHVVTAIVALHSLERLAYAKIHNILNGIDLLDINKWDKKSNISWQTAHELFHTYTAPKQL